MITMEQQSYQLRTLRSRVILLLLVSIYIIIFVADVIIAVYEEKNNYFSII
jgi:hypothetical protein